MHNPTAVGVDTVHQPLIMMKVNVSVMMEFSEDWKRRFADFQKELQITKLVDEQGEIHLPSYAHLDKIFEIARKYEIATILHS